MKKVIDSILDIVLVMGAILCVLTIGGGRWMIEGMENGDPGMLVPYTGNGAFQPEPVNAPGLEDTGSNQSPAVLQPAGDAADEAICPTETPGSFANVPEAAPGSTRVAASTPEPGVAKLRSLACQ